MDGTGTVLTVFTASSNGSYLSRIRFRAAGTNIATVARVFLNNGSTQATATNNVLWDEITFASTTGSATAALQTYELPMNFAIANGYKVLCTIGTTIAAGYYITVIGGDY